VSGLRRRKRWTEMQLLLTRVRALGGTMGVYGDEAPRRPGHCVYCAGPCQGVTTQCEVRVWEESLRLRKEA